MTDDLIDDGPDSTGELYESLIETLEVLRDPELTSALRKSFADLEGNV